MSFNKDMNNILSKLQNKRALLLKDLDKVDEEIRIVNYYFDSPKTGKDIRRLGFLLPSDVARKLNVTDEAIRFAIRNNTLDAQKIGRFFAIRKSDAKNYISSKKS